LIACWQEILWHLCSGLSPGLTQKPHLQGVNLDEPGEPDPHAGKELGGLGELGELGELGDLVELG
jgi:hypothetical protein